MVWVNMSRISTKPRYAIRVEYSGMAKSVVAHQWTEYTSAINQARGAMAPAPGL